MYNINFKNVRKGYGFGLIFLLVGIFFALILGWVSFSGMIKKLSLDSKVEASNIIDNCWTDSEGATLCSPKFIYYVDGQSYICEIGYSSSEKVSSEQKYVYYDSKNPSDCVTDYTVKPKFYVFLFLLIPMVAIVVGSSHIIKVRKNIKMIKKLNNVGVLIKNLPYTLVETRMTVNNRPVLAIMVEYTAPNGEVINLIGDARYDHKRADSDGKVDLLIDPEDCNNYYIDFNIDRKY